MTGSLVYRHNRRRLYTYLLLIPLSLTLFGCGGDGFVRERKVDYRQVDTLPRLDVPPDLSQVEARGAGVLPPTNALGTSTYSSFTSSQQAASTPEKAGVLPRPDAVRVERDGMHRWLVIDQPPERVWPQVREFWQQQGFLINREDPQLGIIETDWAENRADIPKGVIRGFLGRVFEGLYSAPTRDKYRTRLERGSDPGTTEIFLTHWGVVEVVSDTQVVSSSRVVTESGGPGVTETVWAPRPSDPELEAEFLNRMLVYLGLSEEEATQRLAGTDGRPRARLIKEPDGGVLEVDEGFPRAWRLSGIALDHLGFVVEERDRRRGVYRVRATEPLRELTQEEGLLSSLAFWREDKQEQIEAQRFVVLITESGDSTRIRISAEKSTLPEAEAAAEKILVMLEQQLR